jgi:hypothetical protein
MSMKTTSSRPLSVEDIQRAIRPRYAAPTRTSPAPPIVPVTVAPAQSRPDGSPAPLLADMLDQARVHTAVLRTLLADAAAEQDAARQRLDHTRAQAQALTPAFTRAASIAQKLLDAADRAERTADRLTALLAAAESAAADFEHRLAHHADRALDAFLRSLTLLQHDATPPAATPTPDVHAPADPGLARAILPLPSDA